MADNQYSVRVPNILEALMAGQQGYNDASAIRTGNEQDAARKQAAQSLSQGGNPQDAMAKLLSIGDYHGASTIATAMHNNQTADFQNRQLTQQGSQFQTSSAESARHNRATEGQAAATLAQAAEKPTILPPGSGLVDRKGNVLREPTTEGLLDPETIAAMADQYRAGDTSVLTNLGRGAQGAQNIVALRKAIAQKNTALGEGGAEQAGRNAEFFGVKSAARTVGVKGANIDLAATEFQQVLPVVQQASKAVDRTRFPDLNKIIQAYQEKTGDPAIVAFGGAVNTLVNIYARAISPQGVGTVSDKEHAREILNRAWSQGQFNAAVGMMKQEIDAALASPEKVREEQRKRFLTGQPGRAASTSAPTAPGVPAPPPGFQLVNP
jgi:hypothetical protein